MSLDLTASDPQNAQVVISGTVNGIAFACPTGNTTCYIPLNDGQGNITYRVDSSTGLSDSDTTTYKKDSTTPQITGSINASNGLSGWYLTSAFLSASASDLTSGIATFEMNINNTGWVNYAETTFTDGIHTIQYRATDNAGNATETAVQEIKVDTVTPIINISTTSTLGLNNWYVSNVTMNATSSDITSGISSFEINLNNTGWMTYDLQPVTLTDGIHTIQYRSTDNAGNTYTTTAQEIKVDTTTPSLSLSTTGTKGQNDWYISQTSVTPTTTDAGSGIASIEYKRNNGTFNLYTSPLQFIDGIHTYQFKITDNAGNVTTTPPLTLKVDTIAPMVDADNKINLGDTLYYELQDSGSGLWIERIVIEDEDEKYKKIVWLQEISGNKTEGDILWDGKFADKTIAPAGEYYITFKISDQAGNETFYTTEVTVNALSFLLPITPFTPPVSDEIPSNELQDTEGEQTFGNENNGNPSNETTTNASGGETVFADAIAQAGTMTSSSNLFNFGNENTSTSTTNTNILWGAVAAAAVGMTLAEWQKRREEEEKERQSERPNTAGRKKYEEKMRMKRMIGESQALLNQKKQEREKQNAVASARWNGIAKIEQAKEKAKQIASQNTFNHLMNEHKDQKSVYVSKVNSGGSKPLAKPIPPPQPWNPWEMAKTWVNDHVVQPVKDAYTQTVTTVTNFVVNTTVLVQNKVEQTKKNIIHTWENTKTWVADRVVQPINKLIQITKTKVKSTIESSRNYLDEIWNNRTNRLKLIIGAVTLVAPVLYYVPNTITQSLYNTNFETWFGIGPEYYGIEIAKTNSPDIRSTVQNYNELVENGEISGRSLSIEPILIETAIALQNQWNLRDGFFDEILAKIIPSSSTGIGQLGEEDLKNPNLPLIVGNDIVISANDPRVATAGMLERIAPVIEFCEKKISGCEPVDQIIAASMAQNGGGFTVKNMRYISKEFMSLDGTINWQAYYDSTQPKGANDDDKGLWRQFTNIFYDFRAYPENFDNEFMLQRYVNNMRELHSQGYSLPEGITEAELDYMECLANRLEGAGYQCMRP